MAPEYRADDQEEDCRDGVPVALEPVAQARAPYKRVRRLEFAELPKTISGKIRRVELRACAQRSSEKEFREEDMPELRVVAHPKPPA